MIGTSILTSNSEMNTRRRQTYSSRSTTTLLSPLASDQLYRTHEITKPIDRIPERNTRHQSTLRKKNQLIHHSETLLFQVHSTTVQGDEIKLESSKLPSLLGHLSLSPSFPDLPPLRGVAEIEYNYDFLLPRESSRRHYDEITFGNYPHLDEFNNEDQSNDEGGRVRRQEKRGIQHDGSSVQIRTKKTKLSHRYFRSISLLSPPSSSTSTLSPSSSSTLDASAVTGGRIGGGGGEMINGTVVGNDKSRRSKWWSSMCSNDANKRTRFSPDEAQFVGDGSGWLNVMKTGEKYNATSMRDVAAEDDGRRQGEVEGMERESRGGGGGGGGSRIRARSRSSPATFFMPGMTSVNLPRPIQTKEDLLGVLRMRLHQSGGTSAGSQAGLRFKKWVVWNSFHRKLAALASAASSSSISSPIAMMVPPIVTPASPTLADRSMSTDAFRRSTTLSSSSATTSHSLQDAASSGTSLFTFPPFLLSSSPSPSTATTLTPVDSPTTSTKPPPGTTFERRPRIKRSHSAPPNLYPPVPLRPRREGELREGETSTSAAGESCLIQ